MDSQGSVEGGTAVSYSVGSQEQRIEALFALLQGPDLMAITEALELSLALAGTGSGRRAWLLAVEYDLLSPTRLTADQQMSLGSGAAYNVARAWLAEQKQIAQAVKLSLAQQAAGMGAGSFSELVLGQIDEQAQRLATIQAEAALASGRYLTQKEAAAYLKVVRQTLARWRKEGRIKFSKTSDRHILYLRSDLDVFLATTSNP